MVSVDVQVVYDRFKKERGKRVCVSETVAVDRRLSCGYAYVCLARNADFPVHEVEGAIGCLCWSCVEALQDPK